MGRNVIAFVHHHCLHDTGKPIYNLTLPARGSTSDVRI